MLQIGGNCAAITERSFGVPDGVVERPVRHRARDRLLRPRGEELRLPGRVRLPAAYGDRAGEHRAGRTARRAPTWAGKFIQFTLSEDGQHAAARSEDQPPAGAARDVREGARRDTRTRIAGTINAKVNFDSEPLRRRATTSSSSLFDQTITFRHKELVAATRAIDAAAAKLAAKPSPRRRELLAEARAARVHAPGRRAEDQGQGLRSRCSAQTKKDAEATKRMTALEEHWGSDRRRRTTRRAVELAERRRRDSRSRRRRTPAVVARAARRRSRLRCLIAAFLVAFLVVPGR